MSGIYKNFFEKEDDGINYNNESNDLNYSIIISGYSLDVIRNHDYLWDHFCLIAFFATSVIGYELTDE